MEYKFSTRTEKIKASTIRELMKHTSNPSVISLAAGSPSKDAFPHREFAKITEKILKENPILALQYNVSEGYEPLRENCKKLMGSDVKDTENVLITTGAQQAIEFIAKIFVNKNDTVICETPSFIGSINAFKSYEANLVGVDLEEDGISVEKLEIALKENKDAKFIYLIPNFQNPTGVTMSLEKRVKVLELAKKYDTLILEDNPYGELRYHGETLPTIKSLDKDGRVIYVGSFSKTLSPGLRVGFLLANEEIIKKAVVAKQCSDVHTPMLVQMICNEFLTSYNYSEHIESLRKLYAKKNDLMIAEIEKKFDKRIKFTRPSGGLFVWCTLPKNVDMQEFCKKAIEKNVAVVPGNTFLMDEAEVSNSFRMNFSTPTDEQIIKAIELLASIPMD